MVESCILIALLDFLSADTALVFCVGVLYISMSFIHNTLSHALLAIALFGVSQAKAAAIVAST